MTLGETLRKTIAEEAAARQKAMLETQQKEEKRRAVLRLSRKTLIARIVECLMQHILTGREPSYKITDTNQRSWVNACNLGWKTRDTDIWGNFIEWLKEEDLVLKIAEEHDGMGMSDWTTIRVSPKPLPEVEAD